MAIAIDAIEPAFRRMKTLLFQERKTLDFWLKLGFCVFLADLGSVGFNFFGFGRGNYSGQMRPEPTMQRVSSTLSDLPPWVWLLGIFAGVLMVAFFTLLLWLRARGRLMFIDALQIREAPIGVLWKRWSHLGNSLFSTSMLLQGIALPLIGLPFLIWFILFAVNNLVASGSGRNLSGAQILGLVACMIWTLVAGVSWGLLAVIFNAFVPPLMVASNLKAWPACKVFWRDILWKKLPELLLFVLMSTVLTLGAGLLSILACCATCCLATLPYVGSVIFLPVTSFLQLYTIEVLDRLVPPPAVETV